MSQLQLPRGVGRRQAQPRPSRLLPARRTSTLLLSGNAVADNIKVKDEWGAPAWFGGSGSGSGMAVQHGGATVAVRQAKAIWADAVTPENETELAVHKKKVEEIRAWLTSTSAELNSASSAGAGPAVSPILLMTGPTGAGKTTSLRVLCSELGISITEWSNPMQQQEYRLDGDGAASFSESAETVFRDFLLRARRYQPLSQSLKFSVGGKNKSGPSQRLILIEDIPNFAFYRPQSFHDILRHFVQTTRIPLVFIFSDRNHDSYSSKLFPKELRESLQFHEIKFNPIAKTALTKALKRIASTKGRDVAAVDIDTLAEASGGDIRGAINSLEILCLTGVQKAPVFTGPPRKRRRSSQTKSKSEAKSVLTKDTGIGLQNISLDLFQTVGKILNSKRGIEQTDANILPESQMHHARLPSSATKSPEDILASGHVQPDMLLLFLHENYLAHFSSLEDVEMATEHMSDADRFMGILSHRRGLQDIASSVCCRGLIHAKTKAPPPGFKPVYKPRMLDVRREAARNALQFRDPFLRDTDDPWSVLKPADLLGSNRVFTELLPGAARIITGNHALSSEQRHQLHAVRSFSNGMFSRTSSHFEMDIDASSSQLSRKPSQKPTAGMAINAAEQLQVSEEVVEDWDSD